VDVIYIPTDNTFAASMPVVNEAVAEYGVPVICGEQSMVETGGFATLSISYYNLGYQTGLMAVKILSGEAEISTMPIEFATSYDYIINGEVAEALGIEIPDKYTEFVIFPNGGSSDSDSSNSDSE